MIAATLHQLVNQRSWLVEEVFAYLHQVAADAAELPAYLRPPELTGRRKEPVSPLEPQRFDNIRQMVQVVEDRDEFERWLAEVGKRPDIPSTVCILSV